jgi:UDP-glucose 4-epimerase
MVADRAGFAVYNLGTGTGYSVLQMAKAFEAASGRPIPYKLVARRPGDVACVYADTKRAEEALGWRAELGLAEMCADSWRWASNNPKGYLPAEGSADGESAIAEPPAEPEERPPTAERLKA